MTIFKKKTIYKKTQKIRHLIVKIIAPTLYERGIKYELIITMKAMTEAVKERFGNKELTGVEIGVGKGKNAKNILSLLNIKRLYLIDPYESYLDDDKIENWANSLFRARNILAKFKEKVVFILKKSSEAVGDIPDKVDFVYIDGNHNCEYVKKDIELYYPKVKSGGIIGGHDFSPRYHGVVKAVKEFTQEKKLKLHIEEPSNLQKSDWWIIKP